MKIFNAITKKYRSVLYYLVDKINNYNNADLKNNGETSVLFWMFSKIFVERKKIIVFDVGANVGNYSIEVKRMIRLYKKTCKVHMFEPTKKCINVLKKDKWLRNQNINNFGVSDKDCQAVIYDCEDGVLSSLYDRHIFNFKKVKKKLVVLKRLDGYIERERIGHIDILKIDIEGHELFGLKGLGKYLNKDFIDCIQFEYGGTYLASRTYLKDLYELLVKNNFSVFRIHCNDIKKFEWTERDENFQYANFLAVSKKLRIE